MASLTMRTLSFAAVMALAAAPLQADFTNGGFETGDFTGWTVGADAADKFVGMDGDEVVGEGASYADNSVNVRSGDYAALALVANGDDEFLSLSQTITLPDGEFEIGVFLGVATTGNASPGMSVAEASGMLGIYLDDLLLPFTTTGLTQSGFLIRGSEPEDMRLFATRFEATAGEAVVEIRVSGSGSSRVGISIDDAYALPIAALGLAGDFNDDMVVDAADYAVWRGALGDTGVMPYTGADADGDGDITMNDYTFWRNNFGMTSSQATVAGQPAPAPSSAVIGALCLLGSLCGRRRTA